MLLLTHQRPDGDALGSMLGLGHMLRAAGKKTYPVLSEGISSVFRYLPGSGDIRPELPSAFDICILLDCADSERISVPEGTPARSPELIIDHHVTNGRFAAINLVDPAATATAELIVDLADGLGLSIPPEAATCLLAGVVTDTLGFRTPNTGLHTLEVVGAVDAGRRLAARYGRAQPAPALLRRRAVLGRGALAPRAGRRTGLDQPDP